MKFCEYKTLNDFQKYIDDNNISTKKEFRKLNKALYDRYIKIIPREDRNLVFSGGEDHHLFWDSYSTVKDFQEFINNNDIQKPIQMRKLFPKLYDRLCRVLSKDEKKLLIYKDRKQSYEEINTVDKLQNFINNNFVHSRKELHKKFSGLYVKFQKQLDQVVFVNNGKSIGENTLIDFFIKNNIKYESEKTFSSLKNILPLRYDFYLPDYNILVEHHGEGHFGKGRYYSEELINNDKLKYDYAVKNNIPILYYTIYKYEYLSYGYFTEVITDLSVLLERINNF